MWENLVKCCERWGKTDEKVDGKLEKVIEKYEKKARGRGKRGEIGYSG
jgi:hypothetical protein